MNRLAHWMMRLYPSRWRKRYGDEVRALLDDAGADARVVADLFKGAVAMRFSTWSFPRLAAILGLAGMVVGSGISLLTPIRYVARVELPLSGADSGIAAHDRVARTLKSRQLLIPIITSFNLGLYRDELRTAPIQDVLEQMRSDIAIDLVDPVPAKETGGTSIAIRFVYPDRARALKVVQLLAEKSTDLLNRQAGLQYMRTELLTPASLPAEPLSPSPWLLIPGGLVAGLTLALLWMLVSGLRSPVRTPRAFGSTAIALALAGMAVGGALVPALPALASLLPAGWIPLSYQSRATLYIAKGAEGPLANYVTLILSKTSLVSIILAPDLQPYGDKLKTQSPEDVAEGMRRDISVTCTSAAGGATLLETSFTYSDPSMAQRVLSRITNQLTSYMVRNQTTDLPAGRPVNWGTVDTAYKPTVTAEPAAMRRKTPVLAGLLAGILLAMIIAITRHRWSARGEELPGPQSLQTSLFDIRRFRKLALWLTVAGTAAGVILALRTPARYTSDTLVSFENAYPYQAASLINDATQSDSAGGPTWQQLVSAGTQTDAFRIQFVSDDPAKARAVLQSVLGKIDRRLTYLHGRANTPDPITQSVVIPFDDEHAKPVTQPEYRTVEMSVIDTPSLPSGPEGMGWWWVATGGVAGLALAALISLFGGFKGWFAVKPTGEPVGESLP